MQKITAKQIKKEARERFDKEFPGTIVSELTVKGLTSTWQSGKDIKDFLDQLIDTTIKQVLEGVRVELVREKGNEDCPIEDWETIKVKEVEKVLTKLAKEIEGA